MSAAAKWEMVQTNQDRKTCRLAVPGGWLYYVIELGEFSAQMAHSVVFVPKPPGKEARP